MKKFTLKNKLVACGILGTLSVGLLMGASEETNFHKIADSVDEYSLSVTVYPDGYASPDWDHDSSERPITHFVKLDSETEEFHDILNILSQHSYVRNETSKETENFSYRHSGDENEKYMLDFNSIDWKLGVPVELDNVVMNDFGHMNVNNRTYQMDEDSAQALIEDILTYLGENPEIVYTA